MSRMTKTQRVAEKVVEGMSHVDAEIAVIDEMHAERRAALVRVKQKEDKGVESMIASLVKSMHPQVYAEVREEAVAQREAARRSRRKGPEPKVPDAPVVHQDAFPSQSQQG